MSKIDLARVREPRRLRTVALREADWFGSAGFQLYECGFLPDCAEWRYNGLCNPFWRLYYNGKRGSSVVVGGRVFSFAPERLLIIPENTPFNSYGAPGVPHLWIHFSPPVSLGMVAAVRCVPLTRMLAAGLTELRDALMAGGEGGRPQRQKLAHLCMGVLHAWMAEMPRTAHPPMPVGLGQLLEWIDGALGGDVSNVVLAGRVGMSVEGFIRWFKGWMGMTPARYVAGRRIRRACHLLAFSELSIEKVAEATGFANRHHFSRVFARHTKQSPARFRHVEQRR